MKAKVVVIWTLISISISITFSQLTPAPIHGAQAPLSAKQQALIETAKKDGTFEIIATWRPAEAKAIFGAFKEAYPFIKV